MLTSLARVSLSICVWTITAAPRTKGNIDASIGKGTHAVIVVGCVVYRVNSDGVDAELLEVFNVTLAGGSI